MDDSHPLTQGRRLPGQPETAPYLHLLNTAKDTVKAIAIARASIHAAVTDKQPIDWKAWVYDIFEPFDIVDTRDGRSEMQHRAGVIQHLRDAMRPVEQSLIATATPEPRFFSGVSGETAVHALLRYCELFVDIANQLRFLSVEGARKKLKPFAPVVLKLNETWRRTIEATPGVELRSFIEPLGRERGKRLLMRAKREAVKAERCDNPNLSKAIAPVGANAPGIENPAVASVPHTTVHDLNRGTEIGGCNGEPKADPHSEDDVVGTKGHESGQLPRPHYQYPPEMRERDKFIYESLRGGMTKKQVIGELERIACKMNWCHIESHDGIRDAVDRYAEQMNLPKLRAQPGRPRRTACVKNMV